MYEARARRTLAATFGPCLRASAITSLRCRGGRRRHRSHAVRATPTGPARRPSMGMRATALSSHRGRRVRVGPPAAKPSSRFSGRRRGRGRGRDRRGCLARRRGRARRGPARQRAVAARGCPRRRFRRFGRRRRHPRCSRRHHLRRTPRRLSAGVAAWQPARKEEEVAEEKVAEAAAAQLARARASAPVRPATARERPVQAPGPWPEPVSVPASGPDEPEAGPEPVRAGGLRALTDSRVSRAVGRARGRRRRRDSAASPRSEPTRARRWPSKSTADGCVPSPAAADGGPRRGSPPADGRSAAELTAGRQPLGAPRVPRRPRQGTTARTRLTPSSARRLGPARKPSCFSPQEPTTLSRDLSAVGTRS